MDGTIDRDLGLDRAALDRARLSRDARFDGRFFIAVVSTGIYCRPICPAPTCKSRNVRYYATAAGAAEAGFRPCLRCRPEAAPASPAWMGASAVVKRALRLIEQGALDAESVEAFAARLGIGPRHLRRLFEQHVGASPMAVAQTRRLHFAKRLIDETDLPMTQVALESGYGSLRRFNAAIRQTWRRTPSELRRRRRRSAPAPRGIQLRLPYRPPYAWQQMVAFLAARAVPELERIEDDRYTRTIVQDGSPARITLGPEADGDALILELSDAPPGSLLAVTQRARRAFDLAVDPQRIEAAFRGDPLLGPLVQQCPGLRIPGVWDGFECAVRVVLGQGCPEAEQRMVSRLVRSCGSRLFGASGASLTNVFPTAQALAMARLDDIGLAGPQIAAVKALADGYLARRLDFEGPADELVGRLVALSGLEERTAQYIALRALGEPDAFPLPDTFRLPDAQGSGSSPLRGRRHPSLTKRAEAWRPWRSYAALHLWRAAAAQADAGSSTGATGRESAERRRSAR